MMCLKLETPNILTLRFVVFLHSLRDCVNTHLLKTIQSITGTSKSQMLQYVYNLVPRGQYTSGKGSSATGLTAYITRDPETKQVVLQTGNS